MKQSTKVILIGLIVISVGTVLVLGTFFLAGLFFIPTSRMTSPMPRNFFDQRASYSSNGERIYLTGTSESGPAISAQMDGMHRMRAGNMSCAACHGLDAGGGTVRMMMTTVEAPNIRWEQLVEEEHHEEHGEEHPAYTAQTFKRAVTEGINPSGDELHWAMPRWDMTEGQLEDLIGYLQALE